MTTLFRLGATRGREQRNAWDHIAEKYADRAPIGDQGSIESMPQTVLRAFYDRWYRPDNAAIIVVGDIDVDEIVADLERLFGPATVPAEALPARDDTSFDVDLDPAFGLHADPDQQTVDVEVTLPLPAVQGSGTLALRTGLIDDMIYDALVRRLKNDLAAGLAPFDVVTRGSNSFVESLDAPALYTFTDADRVTDTLVALLDEYERAYRFGFTEQETDLARDTLRSYYDSRYEGRESNQDSDYADTLVGAFLDGASYPSIADEYAIVTSILDAVTPEAMARRFQARWANSAPHVIISTPEGVADRMPTEAEVLGLIAATPDRPLDARGQQRDLPDALMERPESQAPLTIESVLPQGDSLFDPVRVVFPNGVTVILNSNGIVEGQVHVEREVGALRADRRPSVDLVMEGGYSGLSENVAGPQHYVPLGLNSAKGAQLGVTLRVNRLSTGAADAAFSNGGADVIDFGNPLYFHSPRAETAFPTSDHCRK